METENENENVQKESDEEANVLTAEDMEYVGECRQWYDTICGKFPPNFGKALSRRERDQKEIFMPHLVYSEITFDALAITILKIVKKYGKFSDYGSLPSSGGAFYDLGSGTGKCLVTASLVTNFASCYGIELLEGLHRGAEWVLEGHLAQAPELSKIYGKLPAMNVIEGDFLDVSRCDWRNADLLFMNATCFGDDILKQIMKLSTEMKKGSFVISVSYAIPSKEFVTCEYTEHDMNWGKANVFIQQKTTEPHVYVEPVVEEEEEEEELITDAAKIQLAKMTVDELFGGG